MLIENWNAKVTNADTIHILGDLMFRNKRPPEEYLSRLKGKKHLVVGNHDKAWMKKVDLSQWFESVEMMRFFSDGQRKITECHYPMMSWPFSNHEGWMVYGHIHENTNMDYFGPSLQTSQGAGDFGTWFEAHARFIAALCRCFYSKCGPSTRAFEHDNYAKDISSHHPGTRKSRRRPGNEVFVGA